jgi:hypothetical protein
MGVIACFPSNANAVLDRFAARALAVLAQIQTPHSDYAALCIGMNPGLCAAEASLAALDYVAAALLFDVHVCRNILKMVRSNAKGTFEQ